MNRCGGRLGLVGVVEAELDQQQAAAVRDQVEIRHALLVQAVDDVAFEPFEADRLELQNLRHVIGGRERVGIAEAHQRSVLGTGDQRHLGFEHDRARAFACRPAPGRR